MTDHELFMKDKTIGIRTQQGLSQHTLYLNAKDAEIYTDLLIRNRIWHYNTFTEEVWKYSPEKPTQQTENQ